MHREPVECETLTIEQAAAHIGFTIEDFKKWVELGALPAETLSPAITASRASTRRWII
jgi:hypothetical protein